MGTLVATRRRRRTSMDSDTAATWIEDELKCASDTDVQQPAPTFEEVRVARKRIRPGRAPGHDGIPSDVIRYLNSILYPMTLIFSIMLRFAVYGSPARWLRALGESDFCARQQPGSAS